VFGATSAILLIDSVQRTKPESNLEERNSGPLTCVHLQAAPFSTVACTGTEPPALGTTTDLVIIVTAGDRIKRVALAGPKPTRPEHRTASPMRAALEAVSRHVRRALTGGGYGLPG
jgi:hypothetical protein